MTAQTKIKSILIEKVRGISSKTFVFDTPEMLGNKLHLLVAANGFGKSSFAGAFDSLRPKSLKIPPALFHKHEESNKAKIEITYSIDGNSDMTVMADENNNSISKIFSVFVINSKLKPHAKARTGYQQFAKATASLLIEPIIIVESIPEKPKDSFAVSSLKKDFGKNGKILPNFTQFLEHPTLLGELLALESIMRFSQKTIWGKIDLIINEINLQSGSADDILEWINKNKIPELQAIPELNDVIGLLSSFSEFSLAQKYLIAYSLGRAYQKDKKLIIQHMKWNAYASGKKRCEDLLNSVNSNPEWITVSVKETKSKLVVELPLATNMSNGQRDLLAFIAQLMKAEFELSEKRAILIVDEVFDYLDECNLLAAQYYISKFVEEFKSRGAEIFPMFLTHLDPTVFQHSALGLGKKDIRKIHFLDKALDSSRDKGIAVMVKEREHASLKEYIGKYFFHYHPIDCDQKILFRDRGLKETWGKSHDFYKYVFAEWKKYRVGQDADFVAACVATRIAIEKHAYDQLENPADRTQFVDVHTTGTVGKLDFTEAQGGIIPESHRLLGLLYNDMLHDKKNFDYISSIVSKMKNPAIRGMINDIPVPASF